MHVKRNSLLSAFQRSYFFSKEFISGIESLNVTWWNEVRVGETFRFELTAVVHTKVK